MINWDAVGAIAEFLGSVGVLATLIYIAVQVRDAKNMNLINASAEMTNNVAGRVIENAQLSEILSRVNVKTGYHLPQAKAAMDEWDLTAQEAEIWARYWGTVWRGFQSRYTAGNLDDNTLTVFLVNPQARIFVRAVKHTFTDDFLTKMESVYPNLFAEDA